MEWLIRLHVLKNSVQVIGFLREGVVNQALAFCWFMAEILLIGYIMEVFVKYCKQTCLLDLQVPARFRRLAGASGYRGASGGA